MKKDPYLPADGEARELARRLFSEARHGALGVIHPATGFPHVTRIALVPMAQGPVTLVSDLSLHTRALRQNPRAGLLLGEPGAKGDALTHPRLSLAVEATFCDKAAFRDAWLAALPKAALYYDFADFRLCAFRVLGCDLNGGFGKAWRLEPDDILSA